MKLDIRVGEIKEVVFFEKAIKPAYKLLVDFGSEIGIKKSSAQITDCYKEDEIIGNQLLKILGKNYIIVCAASSAYFVVWYKQFRKIERWVLGL